MNRQTDVQRRKEILHFRNQFVMRIRVCYGLRNLFRRPWKLVFFAVVVGVFIVLSSGRTNILLPVEVAETPLLSMVYECSIAALRILMFVLLVVGLLIAFGTPRAAREIERNLVHVRLTDRYDWGPVLVEDSRMKGTAVRKLTFYSHGISKEMWESRQQAVEDVLNVQWVDAPCYGGKREDNRNYIVLTVVPGTGPERKEPLYDDEL
ncbi:MAG: hypothetical protein IJB75_08255 [Oscillospiraceae bacterium]|nr:hypothetical protein [Oscillospiraceae bacterium]